MKGIYGSPWRVYLVLLLLALAGIYTGATLPVSLFPNVTQPRVTATFSLQGMTGADFRKQFGAKLESGIKSLRSDSLKVLKVDARYNHSARYEILFDWHSDPQIAMQEVTAYLDATSANMPEEIRKTKSVWSGSEIRNSGFFLATYRSDQRTLTEVFELVNPILSPRLSAIEDGEGISLNNPDSKSIVISLRPNILASLGILPQDIVTHIRTALQQSSGGAIKAGNNSYNILLRSDLKSPADLANIEIPTANKGVVPLSTLGSIELKKSDQVLFKTSGIKSLVLWAQPKEGGNVKRLSEDLKKQMQEVSKLLPEDIKYEVLIDPSVFINDSVENVAHEVAIGASLAVVILYLFIGSLRNVITAAIEIPLSLILAFLLMKLFNMNINLISLGGLALSSGMNVDASVVVMENIFSKFSQANASKMTATERSLLVFQGVKEVFFPILSSTVSSLVVFIPIIFTSDLTHAILGDLAKAVVFSHVFSAVVALVLVPTVRLHLMAKAGTEQKEHRSPIASLLERLEKIYVGGLDLLIASRRRILGATAVLSLVLGGTAFFILPKLPREIIGKPDSNIIGIWASNRKLSRPQQVEALLSDVETKIGSETPKACSFTFTQIYSGNSGGTVTCNLRDKKDMKKIKSKFEEIFESTPETRYSVYEWNLGEMPLPDPDDFRVKFVGGNQEERASILENLRAGLSSKVKDMKFRPSIATEARPTIELEPIHAVWNSLRSNGYSRTPNDLLTKIRLDSDGSETGAIITSREFLPITIEGAPEKLKDMEDFRSQPVAIGEKILPLRALFHSKISYELPEERFENGESAVAINGRITEEARENKAKLQADASHALKDWLESNPLANGPVRISEVIADAEVRDAIKQLAIACAWSLVLIFITMLAQFGTFVEAALVLIAVPLAMIGVMLSLWIFKSSVSLNSVLGMILLNGIAVANSILLVDLSKRLTRSGMNPWTAVRSAARQRLRPILITSLTTILGMMPIAFGFGEGGKVLQPLGIAVSGGMWVSMILTIFMVPALHGLYLSSGAKKGDSEQY